MSLKFKLKSKDEVPAELSSLYVEKDGALVLDVEGAPEMAKHEEMKAKLDEALAKLGEFRKNNTALLRQIDDFKQHFDGINPDEVRTLAQEKRKLEEAQQLKAGEVEKVLESRVKGVKAELEKQLAGVAMERDSLNARLTSIQIDQAVVGEATKRGLRGSALPDITARARNTFRLVNGVPQAFESDGQTVRAGRDGLSPLSVAEWIDQQVSEAPHLFEANAGGGAAGNGSGGAGGGQRSVGNPFRKESWNLTEQMRLTKSDPGLAARLKAAA